MALSPSIIQEQILRALFLVESAASPEILRREIAARWVEISPYGIWRGG